MKWLLLSLYIQSSLPQPYRSLEENVNTNSQKTRDTKFGGKYGFTLENLVRKVKKGNHADSNISKINEPGIDWGEVASDYFNSLNAEKCGASPTTTWNHHVVVWSRLPRTAGGTLMSMIVKANNGTHGKYSLHRLHSTQYSFRFWTHKSNAQVLKKYGIDKFSHVKNGTEERGLLLEGHFPALDTKDAITRPFQFGMIREPVSWCWSWIAFWSRHHQHPHAPNWAKKIYRRRKSEWPSFEDIARQRADETCSGVIVHWFCGNDCKGIRSSPEFSSDSATQLPIKGALRKAICAVKYEYGLVGSLNDLDGAIMRLKHELPDLLEDIEMHATRTKHAGGVHPGSTAALSAIRRAMPVDIAFYNAVMRYLRSNR